MSDTSYETLINNPCPIDPLNANDLNYKQYKKIFEDLQRNHQELWTKPYLAQIIEWIGAENLIFGSDYPHMDRKPDVVATAIALEEKLSKTVVEKILWDNPARFYGLE